MGDKFRAWLIQELDRLKWSHRELARQTGLSHSLVSKTLSGERNTSADFCVKIAQVLGESPIKLLRLAEIIPPAASEDETIEEITELLKNLSPQYRKEVLDFIRFKHYQQGED